MRLRAVLVPLAALMLAACGSGAPDDGSAVAATTTPPTLASPPEPPAERCGPPDRRARQITWAGPANETLNGAVVGAGPNVAVFVHQTGGAGLCGFWPYAVWLADRGVRSVLVDLCGYGDSDCEFDGEFTEDYLAQVALPVEWARSHGAGTVTLVGASMGGSVAIGTARRAEADAVVDLSGPADWFSVPSAIPSARRLRVPLLVAASDADRIATDKLREAVRVSPAETKKYVPVESGHGWDMLTRPADGGWVWTRLAHTVARWIKGRFG